MSYFEIFEFGTHLNEFGGNFHWGGRSFNPDSYPNVTDWGSIGTNTSDKTSFGLSSAYPGHEVLMVVVRPFMTESYGGTYRIHLSFERGNQEIANTTWDYYFTPDSSWDWWWYACWGGIGITDYEIRNNSSTESLVCRCKVFRSDGSIALHESYAIDIHGLDTSRLTKHTSSQGSFWVEGTKLCYISGQSFKQVISGDNMGITGKTPGSIWYEPNDGNCLRYVDSSGTVRRTHAGFINDDGRGGLGGGQYRGTDKVGRIWVESAWHNVYLMFINGSGYQVRLGNSPVTIY